jgi:IS30 family transposase
MTSRRHSEQDRIREAVQDFLLLKMSPEEIQKALIDPEAMGSRGGPVRISVRTTYRYIENLKVKSERWLEELTRKGFMLEYQMAVKTLAGRERRLMVIEQNAARDADKIAASIAIKDIELERINLLADGPTVWALKRQAEKRKQVLSTDA